MFEADSALVDRIVCAANFEERRRGLKPSLIILHYTGMSSAEKAIDWLAREESRVSCHYVIDDDGVITQMVPEALRAWHAGASYWRGETDINSASIGIEIQNPGHEHGYPDFSAGQMRSVVKLVDDIMQRWSMPYDSVLAHSDIAPDRKIDPGEKFPWRNLAAVGIGDWVDPAPLSSDKTALCVGTRHADVAHAQKLLSLYGYRIEPTGVLDDATWKVLRAFQLRFRPARVDGHLDRSTLVTLERLAAAHEPAFIA